YTLLKIRIHGLDLYVTNVTNGLTRLHNKFEFNLATYKRGLAYVEEQLVFYKKNEVMFYDQIAVLKRDASFKDSEIIALKSEIEKLKKEKECNQIKYDKFENAFKCLYKLIRSQISDNNRKGVGYNVVPPPPTGLFAPQTIDLSNSGHEEFQQPEFKGYGPKASKSVCVDTSNEETFPISRISKSLMKDMLPFEEESEEEKSLVKVTLDESMLWHRRLDHINFKTINKLVKDNLVRGFPSKRFENDQTCAACLKGKQHKASGNSKVQNSITQPLFMLHMDLFGPTFVSSLMNKKYCLVVTDDYSRFT
ncbi:ribonuclease H-like domain-containing protein, partial [Tanacetum coccineum]